MAAKHPDRKIPRPASRPLETLTKIAAQNPDGFFMAYLLSQLPLYMLQAWQPFILPHLTDSDMPVSRVIVALEGSAEASDVLLEDFGRSEPSS